MKRTNNGNLLRIAIQKSGRLSEDSRELIRECGVSLGRYDNKLKAQAFNFPAEFLFLRDDDIPEYVADGVADAGIIGENMVLEAGRKVRVLEKLGFSKCRLCIAVPKGVKYSGPHSLSGKSIATSYPRSLAGFLKKNKVKASIREVRGSTEIAPGIGLAYAICDLVSSGSTLMSNGLEETETILRSEAVLVRGAAMAPAKEDVLARLLFRVRSVLRARSSKYILMNVPDSRVQAVINLLPGLKSPTVSPLAVKGWSSVHTVINEDDFWGMIEKLKAAGANGILVCPIEKMIG